jgi:cell division protein FtsN
MKDKSIPNRKKSGQKNSKPLIVITWSNLFGWLLSSFIFCGCIFVVGVLVGRDTVPIEFDIKKIANLPQSYIKELREKNPKFDPNQIPQIDVFGELKDRPPKMVPEESRTPPEILVSESKPVKTDPASIDVPQTPDEKDQTLTPSEPTAKESGVVITSISEEDLKKTETETVGEMLEEPKTIIQTVSMSYVIQVASLNNLNTANSIRDKLIEKGYPAFCLNADIKGKVWHRVRIGPYYNQSLAKNDCSRLKESGLDALLFSVENQSSF